MLAASYWSLLAPAIELAQLSGGYGSLAFVPVGVGFLAGAVFVYIADWLLPLMVCVCVCVCVNYFVLRRNMFQVTGRQRFTHVCMFD